MRNRKQRYQERVYKFQDQQRVSECFEDVYDPIYDLGIYTWNEDEHWDDYCGSHCLYCARKNDKWEDWNSVDSEEEIVCNEEGKVDKEDDKTIYATAVVENPSENDGSLLSVAEAKNQYAVLDDDEEETSGDHMVEGNEERPPHVPVNRVEEKEGKNCNFRSVICPISPVFCNIPQFLVFKEDILDEKEVEDESDWKPYHCKYTKRYVKKRIRIIENSIKLLESRVKIIDSEIAAYKQRVVDTHKWIDSWRNDETKINDDEGYIISTDGLYRKNRKAGYGAIIRNRRSCIPIVASTGAYSQGISELYHELQGINRGLELAIKYGICNNVTVYCRSYTAASLVRSMCSEPQYITNQICWDYVIGRDLDWSEEDFQLMYPLILDIVENSSMFSFEIYEIRRRQNNAADYLAKLGINKEEIIPHDFPEDLKVMLYEDAPQGGNMMPVIQHGSEWW